MSHRQNIVSLDIDLFTHIMLREFLIWLIISRLTGVRLTFISSSVELLQKKTNNEIKITYLSFIDHEAVKIWWCTCAPKMHTNYKIALLLTNENIFMVYSKFFEQWKFRYKNHQHQGIFRIIDYGILMSHIENIKEATKSIVFLLPHVFGYKYRNRY